MATINEHGQPVGPPLPDWEPPALPPSTVLGGDHCRLEPLDSVKHAEELSRIWMSGTDESDWTYLPFGPFGDTEEAANWVHQWSGRTDIPYYAIIDPGTDVPTGVATYLRMEPVNGCIEIGGILYSRQLRQSAAATEAMFLLIDQVFDLGYRRCEWKCDSLNAPSRRAALRLGFKFEGIFRQATICKGRNRDTAWYAIIDREWASLRDIFLQWLGPDNFDQTGRQKSSLSELTRPQIEPITPDGVLSGR